MPTCAKDKIINQGTENSHYCVGKLSDFAWLVSWHACGFYRVGTLTFHQKYFCWENLEPLGTALNDLFSFSRAQGLYKRDLNTSHRRVLKLDGCGSSFKRIE